LGVKLPFFFVTTKDFLEKFTEMCIFYTSLEFSSYFFRLRITLPYSQITPGYEENRKMDESRWLHYYK